jgi:hypothetical protein
MGLTIRVPGLTKRDCLCSVCGQIFSGLGLYDWHRVGKLRDLHPHYGRVCRNSLHLALHGCTYDVKRGVWKAPLDEKGKSFFSGIRTGLKQKKHKK